MANHVRFVTPTQYESLESQDHANEKDVAFPKKQHLTPCLFVAAVMSVAALAFACLVFAAEILADAPDIPILSHCGTTADEAARLGCDFDIMSFSWLPPACFDEELTQEFENEQDWQWFLDQNGTQPASKAEVVRGEIDMFVSARFHQVHCTFMWKKLHRALGRRGFVDSYIGSYNHTVHCEHMLLMKGGDGDELNTRILRKFPTCDSRTVEL